MAKYLYIGNYTAAGAKGVMAEGGSARREAARKAVASIGGTVEAFYYGFGADDFYLIFDAPGNAATAALALTVGSTGAIHGRTVALMTAEEIDEAAKMHPDYTPPRG